MASHIHKSYLWQSLKINSFNDKSISHLIALIGQDRDACSQYMMAFSKNKDSLLIDATEAAYNSRNCVLSQLGRSAKNGFRKQYSLLYLYSSKLQEPVFYRLLNGNISDVKSLGNAIREARCKDITLIGDKAFYSKENTTILKENKIKYIFPIKRNSKFLDYQNLNGERCFKYLDSYIWYKTIQIEGIDEIFIYLNEENRIIEENDYLDRINNKKESRDDDGDKYSMKTFKEKRPSFGTLSLSTNKKGSAEEIYILYKSRGQIEQSFENHKNILDIDGPYMRTQEMLNGWMFLNHMALQWCYDILSILKLKGLSAKKSIEDILSLFRDTRVSRYNNQWNLEDMIEEDKLIYDKLNLNLPSKIGS
jgi:transposase